MVNSRARPWIAIVAVFVLINCVRAGFEPANAKDGDASAVPGEIRLYAGDAPPAGWALCDGRLLKLTDHPKLFAAIGATYGGDGKATFALPDLRGRAPIQAGKAPGLTDRKLGQKGGAEGATISVAELPPHRHTIPGNSGSPDETNPQGAVPANSIAFGDLYNTVSTIEMQPTGYSGGGKTLPVMPPYLALNFIIALGG